MRYNEIDLAVLVHVSRRDSRRRVVSECLARCAKAALPLVETDILRRMIAAIGNDDVRQTVAVEVSNGGVARVPCRRSERRSNSEVPLSVVQKDELFPAALITQDDVERAVAVHVHESCLLYTSPSPRDRQK